MQNLRKKLYKCCFKIVITDHYIHKNENLRTALKNSGRGLLENLDKTLFLQVLPIVSPLMFNGNRILFRLLLLQKRFNDHLLQKSKRQKKNWVQQINKIFWSNGPKVMYPQYYKHWLPIYSGSYNWLTQKKYTLKSKWTVFSLLCQ